MSENDPWEYAKRYQWTSASALIAAGDARLAAVEAERDNQYTQAVEATQRALLAEQALANVEAERDRLKAALRELPAAFESEGARLRQTASCSTDPWYAGIQYGLEIAGRMLSAALSGEGIKP